MNASATHPEYFAADIDSVLRKLTQIIEENELSGSAMGYFPSLYRRMTSAVVEGLEQNVFEDNFRMQELIVVFANLYFEAYYNYLENKPVCSAWQYAFDAAKKSNLIVLQHLLMGVNSHINYDLGIAAAQVCSKDEIQKFKPDFDYINDIIERLINEIQESISRISLPMRVVDFLGGRMDESLIDLSIRKARDEAWTVANDLIPLPESERSTYIHEVDIKSRMLSEKIANQKGIPAFILKCIRWSEKGKPGDKIRMLKK